MLWEELGHPVTQFLSEPTVFAPSCRRHGLLRAICSDTKLLRYIEKALKVILYCYRDFNNMHKSNKLKKYENFTFLQHFMIQLGQ